MLGFAVSTAYWPGMISPAFVPRWGVIAIGVPLVSSMDPRTLPETIRWLMVFLLSLAGMSLMISPDRLSGYYEMMLILIVTAVFIAGAGLDSMDDVMAGLGYGLSASALIAAASPSPAVGLFQNSEVFAEFGALVFVWAIARPRLIIAAISLVPIVLCVSRIAILTAAIGVLFAFWPRSVASRILIIAALVLASVAMLFAFGMGKSISADHRLVLWGTAILTIINHPFGAGLGWFQAAMPQETFAHSDVLQVIAELGVGAVVVLFIPAIAVLSRRGNNAERALFLAVCFQATVSFPLHLPATAFVAALVAGYLVGGRDLVRVGQHFSRTADDEGQRRQDAAGRESALRCGRGCEPVPVRSFAANAAALHEGPDRLYSEPAGL